ncbi:hypothetical protein MTP99_004077 [Tenebrio molitor]|jgi:hypothetical protein|nr:hypothetical protein MTP99_004077 [Tenebrio molitor]
MIVAMLLENQVFLASERKRLFWSMDSAGSQAPLFILKKASKINRHAYLMYTVAALWSIVMLPVFGSHREWMLTEDVCEEYFGSVSKILYHIIISLTPFSIYSSLRHCGSLFYSILQLYL